MLDVGATDAYYGQRTVISQFNHPSFSFLIPQRSMSYEASCMRLVVDLKIADILSPFSDGLHIDDIAIKANVDAGKLVHMLRLLAMRGCFTEGATRILLTHLHKSNNSNLTQSLLTFLQIIDCHSRSYLRIRSRPLSVSTLVNA